MTKHSLILESGGLRAGKLLHGRCKGAQQKHVKPVSITGGASSCPTLRDQTINTLPAGGIAKPPPLLALRVIFSASGHFLFSNVDPFGYSSIDIDRPTREQVLAVIQAIPGKWEKEPTSSMGGAIDYSLKVDGYTLRLWAAPPPPTCRLIEEDVLVPAQPARIEKRTRIECGPEKESA